MRIPRLLINGPMVIGAVVLLASMAFANPGPVGSVTLPFAGGAGTASGYFQLDSAGNLTAWNFQVTGAGEFPAFTYTNSDPNQSALVSGTDPSSILKPNKNGDQLLIFFSGGSNPSGHLTELDIAIECGGVANCLTANFAPDMTFQIATGALSFACDPGVPGKCVQSGEQFSLLFGQRLFAGPAYFNVTGDPVFTLGSTADFTVWTPGGNNNGGQVPEPSSLLLLGTGLTGGFGMLRRRFQK